ncbi:MAG: HAMP domain-containing histidine kinase [Sphingobacteriales bacterium]|nr:MAG: HAMP domain-containing histidine kinase [Sphingobacteriales bacterium]
MKLLNYTTSYFALILLIVISIWAGVFYYAMLDEIHDSIDDGLDNQKGLIIQKAGRDTSVLSKELAEEGDYLVRRIAPEAGRSFHDRYIDTMMYMQNENDYEPVRLLRTVFVQDGAYYQMDVFTSMVEEDDLITELLYALLWLYLGLVGTILVLNNYLLRRIWQPFYRMLEQLKHFRLEKPVPMATQPTKVDEFRLMQDTVQRLLENNVTSYNSQKEFTENAAHELQTPLAISINKLEALAESETLSEQGAETLTVALDNLERLTRLNKSLLLLSRIENRQYHVTAPVDMVAVCKKVSEDFSDLAAYREVDMDVSAQDNCVQQMNPDLAVIMITNLVKNALVHNSPGGLVLIHVSGQKLEIENTGDAGPLDEKRIFDRFYKEEPSNSSTGLGLPIVRAIADLYQFRVSYSYRGRHKISILF